MKKTKFAVLFTALMAVLGLSSCLGDPDPYYTGTEIMKIDGFTGFYSFKSAGGYTVNPTNSELLTESLESGSFAYVTYKYDTRTVVQNSDKIDAEIQYLLPISNITPYGETESNAPMHTVSSESVKFFDKTNMFIDLTYYYENSTDSEKLSEELKKHHFYLSKPMVEDGEEVDNKTLTLNLIHVVDDADNNEKRTSTGSETRHIDLSYFLESETEKIVINFKQSSGSTIDDSAKDTKIEINYKSIMDQYFNDNKTE